MLNRRPGAACACIFHFCRLRWVYAWFISAMADEECRCRYASKWIDIGLIISHMVIHVTSSYDVFALVRTFIGLSPMSRYKISSGDINFLLPHEIIQRRRQNNGYRRFSGWVNWALTRAIDLFSDIYILCHLFATSYVQDWPRQAMSLTFWRLFFFDTGLRH